MEKDDATIQFLWFFFVILKQFLHSLFYLNNFKPIFKQTAEWEDQKEKQEFIHEV